MPQRPAVFSRMLAALDLPLHLHRASIIFTVIRGRLRGKGEGVLRGEAGEEEEEESVLLYTHTQPPSPPYTNIWNPPPPPLVFLPTSRKYKDTRAASPKELTSPLRTSCTFLLSCPIGSSTKARGVGCGSGGSSGMSG